MHKKSALICFPLFVFTTLAQATLLFEDTFGVVPAGPNYSFASDGTPSTGSGANLTYAGLQSSGSSFEFGIFQTNSNDADSTAENDLDFTDTGLLGASDTIYFSALIQVPDVSVFGNNGGNIHVGFDGTGTAARSYGLGLAMDGSGSITFSADTGTNTQNLGGSVSEGETVLVVGRITDWEDGSSFGPPTFEYLLNPDLSQPEPVSWNSVAATGNINKMTATSSYVQVNAFSLSWNADNNAAFLVDEHRVGTTWADVTPAAIPEPSTLMLTGAAFLTSLFLLRRRR